ncbi:MAG: helix-turn-helix transcriptional regulator [Bacillota bacterium]
MEQKKDTTIVPDENAIRHLLKAMRLERGYSMTDMSGKLGKTADGMAWMRIESATSKKGLTLSELIKIAGVFEKNLVISFEDK